LQLFCNSEAILKKLFEKNLCPTGITWSEPWLTLCIVSSYIFFLPIHSAPVTFLLFLSPSKHSATSGTCWSISFPRDAPPQHIHILCFCLGLNVTSTERFVWLPYIILQAPSFCILCYFLSNWIQYVHIIYSHLFTRYHSLSEHKINEGKRSFALFTIIFLFLEECLVHNRCSIKYWINK
jgi:hypothetical protein